MTIHNLFQELKAEKIEDKVCVGNNVFFSVSEKEIEEAEQLLGFSFPEQLRKFYRVIGYGSLTTPDNPPAGYDFFNSNTILPPLVVAVFFRLIIEHHKKPEDERTSLEVLLNLDKFYTVFQGHSISIDGLELLEPGDLPFFEIGDSTRFLIMKLYSDNPNAIWAFGNIKIEDSFEKFIWRLYYESPWFYDDIIEAHYKNLSSSLK